MTSLADELWAIAVAMKPDDIPASVWEQTLVQARITALIPRVRALEQALDELADDGVRTARLAGEASNVVTFHRRALVVVNPEPPDGAA